MRRRTAFRIGGWVLVTSLAFAGLSFAYPGGLTRLGDDVSNYQRNTHRIAEQTAAGRDIDAAIRQREDRVRLMKELCRGLEDGTVRLREAAETYLLAASEEPLFFNEYRDSLPGASDAERMAVALLRDVFWSSPSAPRQRLLAEFHTEFGDAYPLPVESQFTTGHDSRP